MAKLQFICSFSDAAQHLIDVQLDIPALGEDVADRHHEFYMPVWTPGSYLVREYARHVEAVVAYDSHGAPLPVAKVGKDRWRVAASVRENIRIGYRLWAHELSVRTSFVDAQFGYVHPAATFMGVVGAESLTHTVQAALPEGWPDALMALPSSLKEDGSTVFEASDYDALIDSPLLVGHLPQQTFVVADVTHTVVCVGAEGFIDLKRLSDNFKQLVEENLKLWQQLPYKQYILMHLAMGGYGGLEHRASAVTLSEPFVQRDPELARGLYGLLAHEHFHVWNIKRLRPKVLGPFDYGREALTTSLWVAEGLTAYYDDLQVRRAGLMDVSSYLQTLSKTLSQVEGGYGRKVQTLGQASVDAWIKFYRPDESTANTAVSYYAKGALLGFVLDAHVRQLTEGKRSLDDVMRLAYTRYSGPVGYSEQEFRAVVDEVVGTDCQTFLAERIDTTGDWDYSHALFYYGLSKFAETQGSNGKEPTGYLGAQLGWEQNRLMVRQVRRQTAAFEGGLNVGDEVIAIDGHRVSPSLWTWQQQALTPDKSSELTLARMGRLVGVTVTPTARPTLAWRLAIREDATLSQQDALRAWLKA